MKGLLTRLRQTIIPPTYSPEVLTQKGVLLGLSLYEVIDAHAHWYRHLLECAQRGSHRELSPETARAENHCRLGAWMVSAAGTRFADLAEFESVRTQHGRFHQIAGDIVLHIRDGNQEEAERLLKDLKRQSGAVQLALIALYARAKETSQ